MAMYAAEVGEMGMTVLKGVGKVTVSKQDGKGKAVGKTYAMNNSNKCNVGKVMANVLFCLVM